MATVFNLDFCGARIKVRAEGTPLMRIILKLLCACCIMALGTTSFAQANSGLETLADSYNAFGLKLLVQTRRAGHGKNVFLSPAGLAFALSMAADGAQDETLRQMLGVLQFRGNTAALNAANLALVDHLSKLDPKIQLEIANSIWTASDAQINPPYLASLRQSYQAVVASVNFKDPGTADKINGWVNDHTRGKISRMVEPPLGANRLILLDAIYFKGDWMTPFDKALTHDLPFTLSDGESITQPRMSRTGEFDYFEDDSFQAVRLPYAGRAVSMYVFLPKRRLDDFVQNLSLENWRGWLGRFRSRKGTVELPRFKLSNEYKLNGVLQSMGMMDAFTHQANFGGISDQPLYIDWIRQKTYVDVNEEGTEAAAVTGIGFKALAVRREEPPFQMVVDHPFFVAIRENQSGAILFLGTILDPR